MITIRVGEVMSRDVRSVAPDCSFADVVALMEGAQGACVIVCDADRPIGVISERDLVRSLDRMMRGGTHPATAADIMSWPPATAGIDETVAQAIVRLEAHRIRRLAVIDEAGRIAGIVTPTELLRGHNIELEALRSELDAAVHDETRRLAKANRRLKAQSLEDSLLSIGNRRAMELALARTHAQAQRYDRIYSVALFDIDFFKQFNDRYGHVEADRALRLVTDTLVATVRTADSLYRYGGEELLLVMPETSIRGARDAAERARAAVLRLGVPHADSTTRLLTLSAGIAESHAPGETFVPPFWHDVVATADHALYRAKHLGRDRVAGLDIDLPPPNTLSIRAATR